MGYTGKKPTNVVDVSETQSLTVDGDLTVDTNTLKVDSTNNRVGIGTTTTDDAGLTITNSVTRVNNWDAKLALQSTANSDFPALLFSGAAATNRYGGIVSTTDITGNTPANQTAEINFQLSSTTAGNIAFRTNGNIGTTNTSEHMRITSAGQVCVNTTAGEGSAKLSVLGNSSSPGISVRNSGGSGLSLISFINSTNASFIGSITNASDNSVSYNTTSDYRLKENLSLISDAITRVKKLKSYRFNFISSPSTTVDGFLAHEAQEVVPEAVTGTKDQTEAIGDLKDANGNVTQSKVVEPDKLEDGYTWTETGTQPVYQGIDQAKLVPILTAALQEAIAKIETLETKVAALEAE